MQFVYSSAWLMMPTFLWSSVMKLQVLPNLWSSEFHRFSGIRHMHSRRNEISPLAQVCCSCNSFKHVETYADEKSTALLKGPKNVSRKPMLMWLYSLRFQLHRQRARRWCQGRVYIVNMFMILVIHIQISVESYNRDSEREKK